MTADQSVKPGFAVSRRHAVFSLSLFLICVAAEPPAAYAKTPGQTYCFYGVCHRVLTIEETARAVGRGETVVASFYDDPKLDAGNPSLLTSSGTRFDPRSDQTVASPLYPNGTRLLVWNAKTGAAAEVRVTNSGPYHGIRRLDVSSRAAELLGFKPLGLARLAVMVLAAPTPDEARYQKGRTYTAVAGYLGVFESAEQARQSLGAKSAPPPVIVQGATPVLVRRPLTKPAVTATGSVTSPPAASPAPARSGAASGWAATVITAEPPSAVPQTHAGSPARPIDVKALGMRQ